MRVKEMPTELFWGRAICGLALEEAFGCLQWSMTLSCLGALQFSRTIRLGSALTDRPGNRGTVFKVVPNKIQFVTSLSLFTFDITDPARVL